MEKLFILSQYNEIIIYNNNNQSLAVSVLLLLSAILNSLDGLIR